MRMVGVVDQVPFIEAVIDKELQHLTQRLVPLWLLEEGSMRRVVKDDEGPHQREGKEDRGGRVRGEVTRARDVNQSQRG